MEVCHINVWGTVCGDSAWEHADAKVACKQLGYPTIGATTLTVSAVPDETRVIWFSNVRCAGSEKSLFNCNSSLSGNNFCYQSDAGVSCQGIKSYILGCSPCIIECLRSKFLKSPTVVS